MHSLDIAIVFLAAPATALAIIAVMWVIKVLFDDQPVSTP